MVVRNVSLRVSHFSRELLDIARAHLSTETAIQGLFERLCWGYDGKIYMVGGQVRIGRASKTMSIIEVQKARGTVDSGRELFIMIFPI